MAFALAIGLLISQFRFDYFESLFYDARVRVRPPTPVSKQIRLIGIDGPTIGTLGRAPTALDHVGLLRQLAKSGAHTVVYLINPNELVGSYDDLVEFAEAARLLPRFIVGLEDTPLEGSRDPVKLLPPFENVETIPAPISADRLTFARDEVTRRMLLTYYDIPMLPLALASEINPAMGEISQNVSGNVMGRIAGTFEFLGTLQTYVDFRPTKSYATISFQDAMFGRLGDGLDQPLKSDIIFVGRDLDTTTKDFVRTPYSRSVVAMTVLELQANMLDTVAQNTAPRQAPEWLVVIITCLISILTVDRTLRARPARALGQIGATIFVYAACCFLAFWLARVWIDMARPLLATFICYYFFIPYRLIMENRRSWEYFQRNRLLTQVEELKSNFLSMMSHDLKTPLARIQGMAEVVRADPNPLSEKQVEALGRLSRSADELHEFIASVLSLGRIESKEIKLQLKSCDLNSLLEDVCHRAEDSARAKNIEISREFEPIFSVKIDPDLMRQVFSNLIENAIKYSPDGSRILVSSEEHGGKAYVQVADQGPGIAADELPNIFMKFYRAKDAKASGAKGSGLGLYLAKYFAELHKGTVSADSAPGQGSTFTVELPLQAADPADSV